MAIYRIKKIYSSNKDDKRRSSTTSKIALGATALGGSIIAGVHANRAYKKWLKKGVKDIKIDPTKFKKGDIVKADGGLYQHYGVVVDDIGHVIEYNSTGLDPRKAKIQRNTLEGLSAGRSLSVEKPNGNFTPDEIVSRAEARLGTDPGKYNVRTNNCEHFAREVANGERKSTQVENVLGINQSKFNTAFDMLKNSIKIPSFVRQTTFSVPLISGNEAILKQGKHFLSGDLFHVRGKLTKELGGMGFLQRNQTNLMAGTGSIIGAGIGRYRGRKSAESDAGKYGLRKGTYEYDRFVKSRSNEGMLKGAIGGLAIGAVGSKTIDTARGKVMADKFKAMNHGQQDLGNNYIGIGRSMRGIRSENDINNIKSNLLETGDYLRSIKDAL